MKNTITKIEKKKKKLNRWAQQQNIGNREKILEDRTIEVTQSKQQREN